MQPPPPFVNQTVEKYKTARQLLLEDLELVHSLQGLFEGRLLTTLNLPLEGAQEALRNATVKALVTVERYNVAARDILAAQAKLAGATPPKPAGDE